MSSASDSDRIVVPDVDEAIHVGKPGADRPRRLAWFTPLLWSFTMSVARGVRPAQPTRPTHARHALGLGLAALLAGPAAAQDTAALLPLINAYRDAPRQCDGKRHPAAGPLAPVAVLAEVPVGSGSELMDVLKDKGYLAARAAMLSTSGVGSAEAVMRFLKARSCRTLLDPGFAEIGVGRRGERWRIVLARPLLSPDLPGWREAGQVILEHTNTARATSQRCGDRTFAAAPPLVWDAKLGAAARVHSRDMARRNRFEHSGPQGGQAGGRATRAGYAWHRVGENIAAGQGSAAQVSAAWLASPHHCVNIMNPKFTQMGAAFDVARSSDAGIYWTQVFGTPK
jgi:uncharacterized protein YkwD